MFVMLCSLHAETDVAVKCSGVNWRQCFCNCRNLNVPRNGKKKSKK